MAGFGFSACFVDYFISIPNPMATNVFMLIPLMVVFFVLYYVIFNFAIQRFNLKTPGREDVDENEGEVLGTDTNFTAMAAQIVEGLGGAENIDTMEYCTTRLRVNVKDYVQVDEGKIKKARVAGVVRPSQKNVQVIVGPQVQFVYEEAKKLIGK